MNLDCFFCVELSGNFVDIIFLIAEACRSNERDFLPSLEGFFEDAIIELDPRSGVGPPPYIHFTKSGLADW